MRELSESERADAGVGRGVGDHHVHGTAGEQQQGPCTAGERQRASATARAAAERRMAITIVIGSSAATAPFEPDQCGEPR